MQSHNCNFWYLCIVKNQLLPVAEQDYPGTHIPARSKTEKLGDSPTFQLALRALAKGIWDPVSRPASPKGNLNLHLLPPSKGLGITQCIPWSSYHSRPTGQSGERDTYVDRAKESKHSSVTQLLPHWGLGQGSFPSRAKSVSLLFIQ